jgi:hypothetical protein
MRRLRHLRNQSMPLRARFDGSYIPEPNSGCWLWDAAYISLRWGPRGVIVASGKRQYAHRVSYELHVGPIPAGALIRHRCDVTLCVNPAHLLPGTVAQNSADMVARDRSPHGERQGLTTLTNEDARRIARDPRPNTEIARAFGVSDSCVGRIKLGQTFRRARA